MVKFIKPSNMLTKITSILTLLISFSFLHLNVYGQSEQDNADFSKFELIRATLNFLSSDHIVSTDTTFRLSCDHLDYECVESSGVFNVVTGIETWYKRWKAVPVSDSLSVVKLKDRLIADVIERRGKGYRRQLPHYEAFVLQTNGILENFNSSQMLNTLGRNESDEVAMRVDGFDGGNVQDGSSNTSHDANAANTSDTTNWLVYLALCLSVIAAVMSYLAMTKKKEQNLPLSVLGTPERLDDLTMRLRRLERSVNESHSEEAVRNLTEIMELVERRVAELEAKTKS